MWKDSDFRELFQNFNPDPPQKVWEQISYALSNERTAKTISPFYTKTQKITLVVASIVSIFLSVFMHRYIENGVESDLPYAETSFDFPNKEENLSSNIELVVFESKLPKLIKKVSTPTLSSLSSS